METYPNVQKIPYAPTETADLYPESDGKPMADTDLHIQWIIWMREVLKGHFVLRPEVYISGNIMMYDVEGPLRTAVSPDILVSIGIGQKPRRTYKVWEEGKAPDFVMEFSSKRTYQNDLDGKVSHYASMGIPEYFLYDVDRRYLPSALMGFRLVDATYMQVPLADDGGLHSEVLELNFHLLDDGFGIYNPIVGQWLQTPAESATERAQQAEERADQAEEHAHQVEERAEQEIEARQKAEAEVTRLQEEIARLKAL